MPRAQFSMPQAGINLTRAFPTPRLVQSHKAWLRAAQKAIPEIPDCWSSRATHTIMREIIDARHLMFELHDRRTGDRCSIVIERKYEHIGARL
jgi:hypothetical protein